MLIVDDNADAAEMLEKAGTVRLVALTGYGQKGDIERALQAGFDEHLVKPIDLSKLGQLLARSVTK